ncbi:hypothetical protein FP804_04995 [archaeon]|nr:hypothetical protein [archaeon]
MDKTLLVLGDKSDWDSYKKFCKQLKHCHPKYISSITTTYEQLTKKRLPDIESKKIIVYLFFPFKYWDKNIEYKGYDSVYGNVKFYEKFMVFWSEIYEQINVFYKNKKVYFINHPLRISVDRDKELTKTILSRAGIEVKPSLFTRNYKDILRMVNKENRKLFIKVRYGSMGKGMTYMEKGKWKTNFRFENNRIMSSVSDYGWSFVNITDNLDFLKRLLTKDIVIEEAIEPYIIDNLKFDLRFYVCFNDVLYIYPRTNNSGEITTNISQGGKGRNTRFLRKIPDNMVKKASKVAVSAAKAMGLDFSGVDIMISKDLKHVYVIEINAFPGFPKTKRFNLSSRIIKKIEGQPWK